jgi:hypothetical protein
MRKFLITWKDAVAVEVALPETDDPNYVSHEALLRHVLSWSRRYMVWMCEMLSLPDPQIPPVPEANVVSDEADRYVEKLLEQWRTPLADIPQERFMKPEYEAPWKVKYCIDAMLEHAVMHPLRHRFQLLELMDNTRF